MFLMGGGALLTGLDLLLAQECEVPVHVAENPRETVIRGAGTHARASRAVPDLLPTGTAGGTALDAMTFSIVAFDPGNGDLGVAVASKFPCVGAVVPWARAGVGAVATQSWANTDFGPDGLGLMGGGLPAGAALDAVLEPDEDREERQVGFVDGRGGAASFTGANCMSWAGGRTGDGFAAQGNILVGERVVDEWRSPSAATDGDLCDRLLAALLAGDAAGGRPPRQAVGRACSSCGPAAATRVATIGTSTCGSTIIPRRRPSWRDCSRSGTTRC